MKEPYLSIFLPKSLCRAKIVNCVKNKDVSDLEEVFREVHKYDMHLNPKNAPLGLAGENFWGS